ncbi:TIGR03767 family metallophosphoesterase [Calidifontibacter sp. DB0510]|uniref:TIGR03767 family metallophosphoesterase n=1 Tax=Metallococcus carri TaxID=1656884 RepID=A0A967B410_9MICO|nr:TIGR03767 family metallophosphoesterase [Metallococcus carri]NHN55227.1 TIGR03767 family metallophosphoesterase [Metallococcus carri]NOP36304.1 TIGR03767 family metallophosphoesterase [Calidifontibacter sp. DB2511S]
MTRINRRTLLLGGVAGLGSATLARGSAAALDRAATTTARRTVAPIAGTTLQQAATPVKASGYSRLTAGPAYPLVVRTELCPAQATRDDTRTALASIVQFTDLHMVDAQSPVRFEWLHGYTGSAFRPQEALGTQGAAQLVRRVNQVQRGPFGGRRFDCVVSTGDNTDNHEQIELDWFLAAMSGGSITPNTGATAWEGVQTGGDTYYYNPELPVVDDYKKAGFPQVGGFFARATATHTSPGLNTPWFSVFGNHDDSIEGTLPSNFPVLSQMYTGNIKFTGFADPISNTALRAALQTGDRSILNLSVSATNKWIVTPDSRRRPFTPLEFVQAHFRSGATGPGPVGHGFTQQNLADDTGYYAFSIAPGVTGIAMDSTNRAGFTEGSIGDAQWRWIQRRLAQGSSLYYDASGAAVRTSATDELFVLFSHHTSGSMNNLLLDPALPLDTRHSGSELVTMLQRFPNVVAWVNGHTHRNQITPHGHADPARSFWEINTASHIDYPHHARIIEVSDNRDGTVSLFTTLLESAAPYQASYSDGSQAGLASVYREWAYNDIEGDPSQLGAAGDRNTELLLARPRG